jgi:hypothetical protein
MPLEGSNVEVGFAAFELAESSSNPLGDSRIEAAEIPFSAPG